MTWSNTNNWWKRGVVSAMAVLCSIAALSAQAARENDIASTKHNLSVTGPGSITASTETEICVFCHTPHGGSSEGPLWNRSVSSATYSFYNSNSMQSAQPSAISGSSKLCLSCHDGTLAIGAVTNAPGSGSGSGITMSGTDAGKIVAGSYGASSGFTRRLGNDLTNDHPISFVYNSSLATSDGELRDPSLAQNSHIVVRSDATLTNKNFTNKVPLEEDVSGDGNPKVQCTSCHDPHITDKSVSWNIKFLRLNRFQRSDPVGGNFDVTNDTICLACHDKEGQAWADSAHADSSTANETYTDAAATMREFPTGIAVWQAACLNCHDTHTVSGARRLLREGTDSAATPKTGGNSAIEETCYQCHSSTADGSIINGQGNGPTYLVPNIKTDFTTSGNKRMPIAVTPEVHDIQDADFTETQAKLGWGNLSNRHTECTDCHNPHRVMKNRLFNGTGATAAGTHDHSAGHSNIASGVLRGAWGVEPNYGSTSFYSVPTSFTVKKGDGGTGASTALSSSWVTREYQICLKCHSNYGYTDSDLTTSNYNSTRPSLGGTGLTAANTQGRSNYNRYTNQAREFQPAHPGTSGRTGAATGASSDYDGEANHRSWHPVMAATGRDKSARNATSSGNWNAPWDGNVGTQTMYCSDCHGNDNSSTTSVVPDGGEDGNPWGPHGSSNNFLLKGTYGTNTKELCFKCHNSGVYDGGTSANSSTGFSDNGDRGNLHVYHREKVASLRCNWCHVAVPHGWKNKALLVNLNDVGPEAGLAVGTEVSLTSNTQAGYSNGPYYMNARLKVVNFKAPNGWRVGDCGSAGKISGQGGTDIGWMKDVCGQSGSVPP